MLDVGGDFNQLTSLGSIYAKSNDQNKSIEEYLKLDKNSKDRQILKQFSSLISEEYDKMFVKRPKPD